MEWHLMQQWIDLAWRLAVFYVFIVLGILISRKLQENDTVERFVTQLLINVMLPLLMIDTLLDTAGELLSEVAIIVPIAVLAHVLGLLIFYPRVRGLDLDNSKKGALLLCVTFNNAVFLPVPLVLMFMGDVGIPVIALYAVVEMILLAIVGTALGAAYNVSEAKRLEMIKKALLFPPLLAVLLGLFLASLGLQIPSIFSPITSANSTAITYLALLAVGLSLGRNIASSEIRTALEAVGVRQVLVPLVMWVILAFAMVSDTTRSVLLLEAMMPPAVFTVIYASALKLDSETAASVVTIGTLFLLPVVPFLAFII
ncbi:hypothetical protein EU537_00440 [Candidatus Thorarchaeota archaeon]|nr:MAG: hypothetical protein EU537_00440 [Candidatus Thorarchaeota archaeon]